jgi:hypothetical protein
LGGAQVFGSAGCGGKATKFNVNNKVLNLTKGVAYSKLRLVV